MGIEAQVWDQLNPLINRGQFARAIELLEGQLQNCDSTDDLCNLSRKLAHLYRYANEETRNEEKAVNYAFMAGQAYIRSGRMAPAIAMYNWLKDWGKGKEQAENLRVWISETFSKNLGKKGRNKHADDHLPPPTPYREFKAIVTFEEKDIELSREQWSQNQSLRTVYLFSMLKPEEVSHLVQMAQIRELSPGSTLFREGDDPKAFYIVAEGEVELSTETGIEKSFREGEFFGEVALFARIKRTATIKSRNGAKLLEFSEENLKKSFAEFPILENKVRDFYELRLFVHIAEKSVLFRGLKEKELIDCFQFFTPVHIPPNRPLFEQGSTSDRFYLVVQGHCEIFRDGYFVSRLGPGQLVGEMGVVQKTPRNARVVSVTDLQVLECDEGSLQELKKKIPEMEKILGEIAQARDPKASEPALLID